MKLIDELFRSFGAVAEALPAIEPPLGAPAPLADRAPKNRLLEAAKKYGKPFKCAAANMPREVTRFTREGDARIPHIVTADGPEVPEVPSAQIVIPTAMRRVA